ncbi:toll/interleukin-1 receptor domain-containing protein [Alkalicoccobacillus gibsonii]|uniref:toll/interleukin-1 receptor domain-containing protein n=1 Tax=Alkalicoccobacillus gibsonii TaxID=79881 RepID=UPI003514981C
MARCTAPIRGHKSASAAASCPACSGFGRGYRSHGAYPPTSYTSVQGTSGGKSKDRGQTGNAKPSWSRSNSSVSYTPKQVRALTPVRNSVETLSEKLPDLRDVFLCHAWDDRKGVAKDLHDHLETQGVSVWFSEKDVVLGVPLLRAIDKGLANSKVGIVLVTPAMLRRLPAEGVADKELSVLLSRERLIPIVHQTTYDALRDVSPLLGSRSGLDTAEEPLEDLAIKLAELVDLG